MQTMNPSTPAETGTPRADETMLQRIEQHTHLGEKGAKLSKSLHAAVLRGGKPVRKILDFLHGSWLGHPLHVALTEVTIGAWAMGTVFDVIAETSDSAEARRTADRLTQIGTAMAVPTAITGVADFTTIPQKAATPVALHGLLNTCIFGMYLWSLRDRQHGRRRRALMFSGVAQALTFGSAWLGGELVYKYRVGVSHKEDFSDLEGWTPVAAEEELRDKEPLRVDVENKSVMLYRDRGGIFALGAVCSHAGGPLDKGRFQNGCVECPWHHSEFELSDGDIVHGPATQPQTSFEVRTRDGQIEIRVVRL